MKLSKNLIRFESLYQEGSSHFSEIYHEDIKIGWLEEREQGFLQDMETLYCRRFENEDLKQIPKGLKTKSYKSECVGYTEVCFYELNDLLRVIEIIGLD